jgi:hypothetical protein
MKMDLLTNATVVDDAIRFVTEKGATGKPKTDPVVIEYDKEEEDANMIEWQQHQNQKSDNSITTIN